MSIRTILSLAFLSVLSFFSLTESSYAQDRATDKKQKEATYAGKTVSQLAEDLKEKDSGVRNSASRALGRINIQYAHLPEVTRPQSATIKENTTKPELEPIEIARTKAKPKTNPVPSRPNPAETMKTALANSKWRVGNHRFTLKSDGSLGGKGDRFKRSYWGITGDNTIALIDKKGEVTYLRITFHKGYRRGDAAWKSGTKRTAIRLDAAKPAPANGKPTKNTTEKPKQTSSPKSPSNAEQNSTVSIDDFKLVGGWIETVEIDESKIGGIVTALIENSIKRDSLGKKEAEKREIREKTEANRKSFQQMVMSSKGVNGIITFQANGEIHLMESFGRLLQMPPGMTWREIERRDNRLIVEFQRMNRGPTKVELKLINPDRLEVLRLESGLVPLATAREAIRTTWNRAQSDLGEGGKTVAGWIKLLEHESEAVRLEAMNAKVRFGAEAVPPLVRAVTNTKQPEVVRRGIDFALKRMLENPQGDIGEWIELLRHESELIPLQASRALPHFGAKAVSPLIAALDTMQPELRRNVIHILRDLGTITPSTIPTIVPNLAEVFKTDKDDTVRSEAARAMGALRSIVANSPGNVKTPDAESEGSVLPELIESLKTDKNKSVRIAAAQAIGKINSPSEAALDALREALSTDEDALVRSWAADAISKGGPDAKAALPELLEALKSDASENVRHHAVYAIGKISPAAEDVLPALLDAVREDNGKYVRSNAVELIGRMGAAAKDTVPHLVAALRKDDFDVVRGNAAVAIAKIGSQESIPAIIEALKSDTNLFVRDSAAKALGYFGPAAKDVIPALKEAMDTDESARVRKSARLALKRIRAN